MLATILPGLRDLRTPLVSGLMYFCSVWLWFGPARISPSSENDLAIRTTELIDLVGRGVVLGALGLGAYLIGSLLTVREARWTTWLARRPEALFAWVYRHNRLFHSVVRESIWPTRFASQTLPSLARLISAVDSHQDPFASDTSRLDRWVAEQVDDFLTNGWTFREFQASSDVPAALKQWASDIREHTFPEQYEGMASQDVEPYLDRRAMEGALRQILDSEREAILVRIQIEHESLYDGYDRLMSEAELRLSIFTPLTILTCVSAALWSPWILLALVVPWLLLRRGVRLRWEADERVTQALTTGVIQSPTTQVLKNLGSGPGMRS